MQMDKVELRAFTFEVRAEQDEQHGQFLTGQPIVYEQRTNLGWYDEIIDDGRYISRKCVVFSCRQDLILQIGCQGPKSLPLQYMQGMLDS